MAVQPFSRTNDQSLPRAERRPPRPRPNKVPLNPYRKHGIGVVTFAAFGVLLILPVLALMQAAQSFDGRLLAAYPLLASLVTFWFYRHDKKQAQAGEQRIPEFTLHFTELLGGWPGAFLAQRIFRHKTIKASYQMTFWLIIALHEFAALDFLHRWEYSLRVLAFLSSLPGRAV